MSQTEQAIENVIRQFVVEKRAPESLEKEVLNLPQAMQSVVSQIIYDLQPSANMLSDYLRFIREVLLRDGKKSALHNDSQELQAILSVEGKSRKEKLQMLRKYFERLRYPEMARIEAELDSMVRQIVKNHGVRVELPQDLEGARVRLEIEFQNPAELSKEAGKLQQLSESKELARLFQVLLGRSVDA